MVCARPAWSRGRTRPAAAGPRSSPGSGASTRREQRDAEGKCAIHGFSVAVGVAQATWSARVCRRPGAASSPRPERRSARPRTTLVCSPRWGQAPAAADASETDRPVASGRPGPSSPRACGRAPARLGTWSSRTRSPIVSPERARARGDQFMSAWAFGGCRPSCRALGPWRDVDESWRHRPFESE